LIRSSISRWHLRAVTDSAAVYFWKEKKERICSSKPFAAQKQNFSAGWVDGSDLDLLKFSFLLPNKTS
jgi:hypothetical protein